MVDNRSHIWVLGRHSVADAVENASRSREERHQFVWKHGHFR